MGNENGTWVMHGVSKEDPKCIQSVEQLEAYIEKVGFLPLFQNEIPGFSVEEYTVPENWWCGNSQNDPWEWRQIIASRGEIAYGKFFDKKAGFVSKKWLPYFVNYRRDGYDFDALWEDEKASFRHKKIMDCFEGRDEILSSELKELAGFGKGGEKNFEGNITALQMSMYLCVKDFRCRKNKKGQPFGWPVAVYTRPETIWGADLVTGAYCEEPIESGNRIYRQIEFLYGTLSEKQKKKL